MTRSFVLFVVVASSGCIGSFEDGGFFEGEGEGECCGRIGDDKQVTLRLGTGAAPQRFDLDVVNDGVAFDAFVDVIVDRATGVFSIAVNSDPAFVDDTFNYQQVDVGSVASAQLRVDENGAVGPFSFGAVAGAFDVDVDLTIAVTLDADSSEDEVVIGRLAPRTSP